MKKPKIKKRGGVWIVGKNIKCYSIEAALLWARILGRGEKSCT